MVTSKQIKEKIRDYRRTVKHSWQLYKESKIGLIGLTIMIIFVVMALVSPYMGLRHPLNWWAPDEDQLEFTPYIAPIAGEEGLITESGPVLNDFSVRFNTDTSQSAPDRLYVAGEDTLYTYEPSYKTGETGLTVVWKYPTTPPSNITTKVHYHNFGVLANPSETNLTIFFGTENGKFYLLKDQYGTIGERAPTGVGTRVWDTKLDGSIVGIDFYEYGDKNFNYRDLFFVSTSNGTLHAFRGPLPVFNNVTNETTFPLKLTEIWNYTLQNENASLSSPSVSRDGQYVFVGSDDGYIHGIDVVSGELIADWGGEPYRVSDTHWSGSPAAIGSPIEVYAATDNGIIHGIWGVNKTVKNGWIHLENNEIVDGFQLKNTRGELETGRLTSIAISDFNVMVGSSNGFIYSVNKVSANQSITFDTRIDLEATTIEVAPYYSSYFNNENANTHLYIFATHLGGTPTDRSDDFTILYCLNSDAEARVIWRKTIEDGVVLARPVLHTNFKHLPVHDLLYATVSFEEGTNAIQAGKWFSIPAIGFSKGALPPTWATKDKPPSGTYYWLGTDSQGHDILSQTILGSRIALLVGFLSALFSISIGVIFGLVAGYYGGWVDSLLMRFTDVILVLPGLPLLITFAAIMNPGIWNIILIISIVGWGGVARVIRAEVLSLKERPFIDSARVTGASKSRIMFKHIAPNVLPLGLLYMTFAVGGAILYEASLSFIGLGDPSTMSWGMMLNYVQQGGDALTNWWWLLPPGICITLVCMSFFLLGRAFDEIVNPRLRRRR